MYTIFFARYCLRIFAQRVMLQPWYKNPTSGESNITASIPVVLSSGEMFLDTCYNSIGQCLTVTCSWYTSQQLYFRGVQVISTRTSRNKNFNTETRSSYRDQHFSYPSKYQCKCINAGVENKEAYHIWPSGKLPQLTSSRLEKTPGADSLFLKANYGTIDGWYHYEIRVSAGSTLKDINKLTGGNWRFYKTLAGQSIKLSS